MNLILSCLKDSKISDYRLIKTTTTAKEWFFIQKKLDISRAKKVTKYQLTIYQTIYETNTKFKGSATCTLDQPNSYTYLMETIAKLAKEAKLVKNPFYDIPSYCSIEKKEQSNEEGEITDVLKIALGFREGDNLSLNSFELFDNETTVEIINSKGVHVKYSYPHRQLEMIVNATNEYHEIEIYHDMKFGTINRTDLRKQLGVARKYAADRLVAKPIFDMPKSIPVILSQSNVLQLYKYYLERINAANIYKQKSDSNKGSTLGPDFLNLESLSVLEDSSKNIAYDNDARPVLSMPLIKDGKVISLWGEDRYCRYLGMDTASGAQNTTMVYNFKVGPGTMNMDELKLQPYLELVSFSDFNCNPITGDFSGEIRLGYFFNGEHTYAITSGSLSGNIKDNESTMQFSDTLEKYDYAVVPNAIVLYKVNIAK